MRVTSKGQVTIPQEIREELGLLPNTEVFFVVIDGEARLRKADPRKGKRHARADGVPAHAHGARPMSAPATDEMPELAPVKPD
jgi:AbrB family looped-hinge helix DNA binding protein